MKTLFLVLLCACATYAASSSFFSTPGASFSSRRDKDKGSSLRSSKKTHRKKDDVCSGSVVDASHGGSDYHFSWCNPEFKTRKFTGGGAEDYCSRRAPQGPWRAVTISDKAENDFIKNIIKKGNVEYIWTGGSKTSNGGWIWKGRDASFGFTDWSHTGGLRTSQPDNRMGDENCLAILNNVYKDGIKWHDVACSHTKPIICEKIKS